MLKPGWLDRQLTSISKDIDSWPQYMKDAIKRREYCDFCDGCGWYEGGKTFKTTCHKCKGTGVVYK